MPHEGARALERRATLATVAFLLALAALGWWSTVHNSGDMGEMVQGLVQVGRAAASD